MVRLVPIAMAGFKTAPDWVTVLPLSIERAPTYEEAIMKQLIAFSFEK
jgi:hypothetical protein